MRIERKSFLLKGGFFETVDRLLGWSSGRIRRVTEENDS